MISTLYDFISKTISTNEDKKQTKNSFICQTIESFSAIRNFKSIFFSVRPNEGFKHLDAIRSILCFTVLFAHSTQLSLIPGYPKNISFAYNYVTSTYFSALKNFCLIDTFFFIGGRVKCILFDF